MCVTSILCCLLEQMLCPLSPAPLNELRGSQRVWGDRTVRTSTYREKEGGGKREGREGERDGGKEEERGMGRERKEGGGRNGREKLRGMGREKREGERQERS